MKFDFIVSLCGLCRFVPKLEDNDAKKKTPPPCRACSRMKTSAVKKYKEAKPPWAPSQRSNFLLAL